MGTLFVILVILAVGAVAWKMRVPLMAKVLGQSESRVRRQIERKRR